MGRRLFPQHHLDFSMMDDIADSQLMAEQPGDIMKRYLLQKKNPPPSLGNDMPGMFPYDIVT